MSHMYENKKPIEGEELYSCSNCTITFTDRKAKLRHVENHRQGKNYICTICQTGFFREEFQLFHLTVVHGTKESSCIHGNSNLPRNVSIQETSFVPGNASTLRESVTGSGDVTEVHSGSGFSFRYHSNVLYTEVSDTILSDDSTATPRGYLSDSETLYGTANLHEYRSTYGPRIALRQGTASGTGAVIGEDTTFEIGTAPGTETASGHESFSWTQSVKCKPASDTESDTPFPKHGSTPTFTPSCQPRTPPAELSRSPAEPMKHYSEPVRSSSEAISPSPQYVSPSPEPGRLSPELGAPSSLSSSGSRGSSSDSARSLSKWRASSKRKLICKRNPTSGSRKATRRWTPFGPKRPSSGGRQFRREIAKKPSTSFAPSLTYEPETSCISWTSYGPGPPSGAGSSSSHMMSSGSETTSLLLKGFYSVEKML